MYILWRGFSQELIKDAFNRGCLFRCDNLTVWRWFYGCFSPFSWWPVKLSAFRSQFPMWAQSWRFLLCPKSAMVQPTVTWTKHYPKWALQKWLWFAFWPENRWLCWSDTTFLLCPGRWQPHEILESSSTREQFWTTLLIDTVVISGLKHTCTIIWAVGPTCVCELVIKQLEQ